MVYKKKGRKTYRRKRAYKRRYKKTFKAKRIGDKMMRTERLVKRVALR